ncbi:lipopolysaccharide biosynthesis protein [Dyadobacter chenhuakuii]|uniref:Lipopolysaccharide biosynthesis protein n=1 Tax=Dyadobacter chenhuakuii TaxID=2909339 RepID=A0ABY4XLR4_9BACT|nr:lipopolysaccharide biosynthesis protein [Dyadobacter chenhuakuii]MCF2494198.1 lipopolysaccharide biosynthesis protein [Dyadobacter chenhuakuii]USJ31325.1 lipopolysaccharide biosynthesis protein [Dyadobacter chenhuakuii]
MSNSKSQVIKGVFWSGLQLVINQSLTFAIRLVLAKILFPEQFGVVGMATVFTGFVQVLNDIGIGAALIQRKDQNLRNAHFHTAFWTGVLWSTSLYLLISFGLSGFVASYYNEPIIKDLIPVLSLGILSSPINLVHKAQLTKQMNFKKMAFIDNIANVTSGVISLILAFAGFGIWSLAFNSVASIVIAMPLYFWATKWTPKFIWETLAFKEIFGFGMLTTLTSIVNYIIGNIDYLIIGKLLNATLLGSYTLAFVLTDTFRNRLTTVMNTVLYPLYGKKQNDSSAVKRYYLKVIEYNCIIIYPIMLYFVVFSGPFIYQVFGSKWVDTIDPLKILAGSVLFSMMVNSNTVLIRGLGFAKLELQLQIVKALIFLPSLAFGIYYGGINGAAWAVLANKVFAVLLAQYTFNKLLSLKISSMEFCKALATPVLATLGSAVVAYTLLWYDINYIVAALIIILVYAALIWLRMKSEILATIRDFRKAKEQPELIVGA